MRHYPIPTMSRKIEQALSAAVAGSAPFKGGNTIYDPHAHTVILHGSVIAKKTPAGAWRFNLCGYNTPTTRSRINALGAGVSTRKGTPYANGLPVPTSGWFDAYGLLWAGD